MDKFPERADEGHSAGRKRIRRMVSKAGMVIQSNWLIGGRMRTSQLRLRYWRIMAFFANAILGFVFWELLLSRIGLKNWVRRTRSDRYRRIAARFRSLAIRMGGVMIKVGQFLSSRLDVLPPEITAELSGLQDEVPAEKFEDIRREAESDLGAPLKEKFESFEETPLAAASLGQVHRARLCVADAQGSFCNVVVKVQRPFIDQLIEVDLTALRQVGRWLQKYPPLAKRVDVPSLLEEFSIITRQEVDYLAEGHNAERFTENFKAVPRIHVPRVVWSHTTRKVLVLEDVFAIKITDFDAITSAGIDRADVANELFETYLKQIFEDGFFHADPHPGNLFITPVPSTAGNGKTDWRLTFVDFGMVGLVPDNLRLGLREMLISVGTRDASRLVRVYQTLDVLLPGADLKLIEQAESELFDLFWGKSMSELRKINHAEMFRFADKFRELMYSMPFQLPQNLLMLGRTVAILSGMCTGLNPDFNLWVQLSPYAGKLVSAEGGSNWRVWLDEFGNILKELVALPSQAGRVLSLMERGDLSVQVPAIDRQMVSIEKAINRLTGSIIFSALLLGGLIFYRDGNDLLAYILLGCSGLVLIWMVFPRRSGPRRFHP
jgi:predicted unusual protein kinase regulating ubiquinone biosynthesis (AarF/ABC1/UbiB family)